jgi:ABC-type dipeptide/oligopeptide/nickel transport system permease subunit
MTEPTQVQIGRGVAPPQQTIDSTLPEPPSAIEAAAAAGLEIKVRSQWSYARRRFLRHRLAMAGLVVLVIIFAIGALANVVAPYSYVVGDYNHVYAAPSWHHLFGTDDTGRDYFSRVIYGIRTSFEVGVFVAVLSSLIGLLIGAVAGYYARWTDNILMRITDLFLTLPFLAILATAAALLGQGNQWRVSLILALLLWTNIARVVRGVFLSLREKEYVEAARASGAGDMRIMFRHILPNTLGPIIVNGTLSVAQAILIEAAISFLGFGLQPPTVSLGLLTAQGQTNPQAWWLTVFPGITIVLIVLCVNFVGDGLRDALDPQQRRLRA